MRQPKFLSPSAIDLFYSNRQEYYLKYLADKRPPRMPQTKPMSIGSAFDAYAKNYIVTNLFDAVPEGFEFEEIFEAQVETQNRIWAREHGKIAFDQYKQSGALSDLMIELERAQSTPRFEFTVEGELEASNEGITLPIPLLGKPDIYFVSHVGAHIIVDWKVNGYCSKNGVSPKKGYVKCRDGWTAEQAPHSRSHNTMHKDAHPLMVGGLEVNIAQFLEDIDEKWATQLCIYAWLLGEEVGARFIICIEQLACKHGMIRVASHRARSGEKFQLGLMMKIFKMWSALRKGHIFDDLSFEENKKKCHQLDQYYKAFEGTSKKDKWFTQMTRKHGRD